MEEREPSGTVGGMEIATASMENSMCYAKSGQLCLTLCDPMDCSLPGSSVHGILQARILERVAFPPPGDLPHPGIEPASPVPPALQVDSLPLNSQEALENSVEVP